MHTLLLRSMTLAETGHSTGQVSLPSLLDGEGLPLAESALGLPELVSRVVTGGWPGWFNLAQRLFLVEDQPAWSPSLRSASAASQAPARHLVDPSLAAVLLGAGSGRLMTDPQTLGFLFESQVVHDLRVYAQAAGARGVFHYRDTKGRDEIDAVVEGADGQWLAVEVRLGEGRVEEGAANLLRVTAKMTCPPLMCLVVVTTGVAHVRPDGVGVLPLTALGA